MFEDVLARGIRNPAVSLSNLALAESFLGNTEVALEICERAYDAAGEQSIAHLWTRQERGEWTAPTVEIRRWITRLGADLEQSRGLTDGIWTERLRRLELTEFPAPFVDPSSARTDEEDL